MSAVDVIRHFRDFMQSAPDELTAYAALLHGPDGTPLVGVIPCYCGDIAEGERVLRPLRTFGSPVMDAIQPMPFPVMQSLLGPSFPDGNQNYWKSTLQRELTDDAITAIVEHGNRMRSPLSCLVVEYYGGAASRVPKDATAFPHRDLPWDILFLAQWTDAAETIHRDWARSGEEMLRPFSSNAHLLSALDVEGEDVINTAWGANLPRLAAIKKKYDPTNFFRVNQNIKPRRRAQAGREGIAVALDDTEFATSSGMRRALTVCSQAGHRSSAEMTRCAPESAVVEKGLAAVWFRQDRLRAGPPLRRAHEGGGQSWR